MYIVLVQPRGWSCDLSEFKSITPRGGSAPGEPAATLLRKEDIIFFPCHYNCNGIWMDNPEVGTCIVRESQITPESYAVSMKTP